MLNLSFPRGPAQFWATCTLGMCAVLLAGGHYFEFIMGLEPCPLCMMQRVWFIAAAMWTYISLVHKPGWGIYPVLTIVSALIGAYFAARHLGLQDLPADQVPACGASLQFMLDADFPWSEVLSSMVAGGGDCAKEMWSLAGITIPGWALIGFILIIASAGNQLRHAMKS
ncbi:MAG: disulfide bond formation protein B [Pseudomonadota bacterium]